MGKNVSVQDYLLLEPLECPIANPSIVCKGHCSIRLYRFIQYPHPPKKGFSRKDLGICSNPLEQDLLTHNKPSVKTAEFNLKSTT